MSCLTFDPSASCISRYGVTAEAVSQLAPRLEAIRREMLEFDLPAFRGATAIPHRKLPLDSAFHDLPDRLLAAYRQDPKGSELGRILAASKRLAESVDRVVILGIGGSYMGARALLEGCRPPYHNERSREARGGAPRIYFEGNNVDNDATQGLLAVLGEQVATNRDDAWGLVVISKSGGTLETAVAFRQFLAPLQRSLGNQSVASRLIPITGTSGKLYDLAKGLGCTELFEVPDGVGGRFSILSAVGLIPAAIMGLDVIALLEGAAEMNERFRSAPPGDNPALDYVAYAHLLEQWRGIDTRVLSVWNKGLEALGLWYDQLLAESLGKDERGALPLTVVNTRDLHSRAQQHQEGRRDKVFVNLIVDQPSTPPLAVGRIGRNDDGLDDLAHKTLPEIMAAAIAGTNQAYAEDARPTMDIRLPAADERSIGQFLQMMMLATVVEGRLMDVNPYGQPGVENYKRNMNRLLRS